MVYPVDVSDKTFEDCMDLLLITDGNILHYVYINDFNKFMYNKTKHKNKNVFADIVCSALVVKIIGRTHKNLFNNHW